MEFRNLKPLKEITTLVKRGITPKYSNIAGIEVINQRCIRDGKIDFNLVRNHDPNKNFSDEKKLKKYDVLVNSTGVGTLGRVAQFYNDNVEVIYTADSHVTIIRAEDHINKVYFGYAIKEKENFIESMGEGSTGQTELSRIRLEEEVFINVPPIKIQNNIAEILLNIDKKLEINNKIIENLESQAQAIFKSWFVDFEPFQDGDFEESELGLIPEGWDVNQVGKITSCKLGGTPSRKKEEFWGGEIPWINSGAVNKERILQGAEYITEEGLNSSSTKLLPKKTTLVAITGATLGQVSLLEIDCCTNQSVIGILENEEMPYEFIYLFIKENIKKIILNQTGAAQQHINLNDIRTTKILIPDSSAMGLFKGLMSPIFMQIENLYFQNQTLAQTRDTLLPKLMSGEIDISNIKIDDEDIDYE
ncbi:restriction endonuclease subunit S [Anaerococcus nagyae]|uniref:restriction endonuclease subunit S n=1 Tax=Anaerococcus nagyae TaxID=1755241 RepID=UPI00324CB0A7